MVEFLNGLFGTGSFIPHGHCYLWKPGLVWLNITSDALIAIAYYSIPITLFYFVKRRHDLPFNWIFLLFGTFIVACGTTHLMEVWTLWHPTYWLSASLKAITAVVSVFTAIQLIPIVPRALSLPSPAQLEQANQALQAQISERLAIETELRQYQTQLEALVGDRTAQLSASNRQMEELLNREQEARSQAEKAKAEIQTYADQLTLALSAAKMGSWDWNLTTNSVSWTPIHKLMFGYEADTPTSTYDDWANRVHPTDLPQVEAALHQALANHKDYDYEYRLLLPDGTERWIDAFGRGEYNSAGEPVRMVGMVLDITNRKLAEAALRESEETARRQLVEIEAIYATAPIGLCVLDREFRFVRLNQFLAEMNGLPIADQLGHSIRELLPELGDVQEPIFRHIFQTGMPVFNTEFRGTMPAQPNKERDWLISYYPLRQADEQIQGVNITIQEITELKRAEQALQERATELTRLNAVLEQTTSLLKERNQELDQFAYVVSHDLKAPLRAIANLSEWVEEDLGDQIPEANQHQLQLMRRRVYRLEALINGLLEYSRVGRKEVPIEPVDTAQLLTDVLDSLAPPSTFQITIEPGMPTLITKKLLLSQVFSNLIGNGIRHHPRTDGTVTISVEDEGFAYKFAISDDGSGIDPNYHQRIFTIFQTLKARDEQENTGIGLSIVKKIIETEGGSIWLESQLNQGATFYFTWLKHSKVKSDLQ